MLIPIVIYLIGVIVAYLCIAKSNSKLYDPGDGMTGIFAILSWATVVVLILIWAVEKTDGVTWPFKTKTK